jgi:phenylacetate-CoA ligase
MRSLKNVYERLPLGLQNAAMSLYGARLYSQRYGYEYERYKRWLYDTETLSPGGLREIQEAELMKLVRFVRNLPFFREHYREVGKGAVRGLEDLHRLPPVSKELMRRNLEGMRTGSSPFDIHVHTGGTTGTPMEVVFWRRDFQRRIAMLDYYREKWGFEKGMRRATFSGRIIANDSSRPFWRHNTIINQRLYSTFHLAEENLGAYADDLRRFKPMMIDGFPSAIGRVARYMVEHKLELDDPPRVVFSTSEGLYDFQRDLIERAFGCKSANQYGSAEGAPIVAECPLGALHYDIRSGVIEPRASGDVLVTSFTTYGTPLVRYEIGDSVELFDEPRTCSCGNNNPLVKSIVGRSQDFLVSPERGLVAVGLVDIFKKTPAVFAKSQIVQRELGKVELLLVAEDEAVARPHLKTLDEEIRKRMGVKIEIEFKFVSDIEPERSGKHRYIKNLLPEDVIRKFV